MATLKNPTIWLFATTVALWTVGWVGYLGGTLPGWAAVAVNAVAAYLGFTVFHESVHRTAHRHRLLNDALGWLPALMLTFTYPVFRSCHLQHHAHTNDPDLDPDLWVANRPGWLRPIWLVGTAVHYRRLSHRHRWGTPAARPAQIALDAVLVLSAPDRRRHRPRRRGLGPLLGADAGRGPLPVLRLRLPAPSSPHQHRALPRHPHPTRSDPPRPAAGPELPPDPPPVGQRALVPLPDGLRPRRRRTPQQGRLHRRLTLTEKKRQRILDAPLEHLVSELPIGERRGRAAACRSAARRG